MSRITWSFWRAFAKLRDQKYLTCKQGRNEGGKGEQFPGRRTTESLLGTPKSPNNVISTFFNTLHLLPKDLRLEHRAPNLRLLAPSVSNLVTPLHLLAPFLEKAYKAFHENCGTNGHGPFQKCVSCLVLTKSYFLKRVSTLLLNTFVDNRNLV